MNKKLLISTALIVLALVVIAVFTQQKEIIEPESTYQVKTIEPFQGETSEGEPEMENPAERLEWEMSLLLDPATGEYPAGIKQRELKFAQEKLNARKSNSDGDVFNIRMQTEASAASQNDPTWISAGPFNVGGRTRALAIDTNDENTFLAGGVKGGLWKTTDGGQSWTRKTPPEDHPSITTIVQDLREGKNAEWYYGTGELSGSGGAVGAFYSGNGIYKSTDNGETWTLIQATALDGSNPQTTLGTQAAGVAPFSVVNELVIDLSNADGTEIYAATESQIMRSTDGFETWEIVLGASNSRTEWTDVAITSTGIVYATIASGGGEQGFFRSDDGINWTNVELPSGFSSQYNRIEIEIDPNNEALIYLISDINLVTYSEGSGQFNDVSRFLPFSGEDVVEVHDTQGGYNLHVKVKPGDAETVFIGGTNLFRSTNRFTSTDLVQQVGGYAPPGNEAFLYPNHHPDQHALVFFNSDANKMISGTDGGVHINEDNTPNSNPELPIVWRDLNNGYLTSQFYHVDIHQLDIGNPIIIGGMQDNSTFATLNGDPTGDWQDVGGGDGTYAGITYNSLYVSFQRGGLFRYELVGNTYQFQGSIAPAEAEAVDFLFVNPYTYNPVNQDQLAVGSNSKIFVTNDVRTNPSIGDWVEIRGILGRVSALVFSTQPQDILYVGTNSGNLFKISDIADATSDTEVTRLPTTGMPSRAYVSSIEVNPDNADQVLVSFSNYNVESIFASQDGGQTWTAISGNLEETPGGAGNGPSVRYLEIMPDGEGGYRYFAGTSVGLFMTTQLNGDNTNWVQQGADVVGNTIVTAMQSRPSEGKIVAATHSNGVFSATYNQVGIVPNIRYSWAEDRSSVTLVGNDALFNPSPLTYQWIKNGEDIDGATNIEFVANDGGTYQLRLTHSQLGTSLSNEVTFSLDGQAPEISSIARLDPTDETTSATSVQFRVTFNEEVANVSSGDFETTGDASGVIGTVVESTTGLVFDVTVQDIGGSGTLGLTVASANDIRDLNGNDYAGVISVEETYTIQDTSAPSAVIARNEPTDEVTDQNEVSFIVNFNEQVTNVDLADFALASTSPTATLSEVRELTGGRSFIVTIVEILEDGVLDLDFASAQNITDLAGNNFEATVTSEETFNIQNVISSIDEDLLLNVEDIIVDANPSNGVFNIAFPSAFNGDFQLQIIDANGRKIQSSAINNYRTGEQVEIDLRNSPDGLYILNAANDRARGTVKLLKSTSR